MKSIITELQSAISRFTERIDNLQKVMEKEKSTWGIYNQDEQRRRQAEANGIFSQLTQKDRESTSRVIADIIDTGRVWISNSILELDTHAIERLEAMFKASDGMPSDYVMNLLLSTAQGDYWSLEYIYNQTKDENTGISKYLNAPNPQHYLDVLDDIQNTCNNFINGYAGEVPLSEIKENDVRNMMFLSSQPWEKWADLLNANEHYVTEFSMTNCGLTASEKEWLSVKMGSAAISTKDAQKNRVAEILESSGEHARAVLMRSPYACHVTEIEKEGLLQNAMDLTKCLDYDLQSAITSIF